MHGSGVRPYVPDYGLTSVSQHYAVSVPGPPRLQWVLLDLGCPASAGGLAAEMG